MTNQCPGLPNPPRLGGRANANARACRCRTVWCSWRPGTPVGWPGPLPRRRPFHYARPPRPPSPSRVLALTSGRLTAAHLEAVQAALQPVLAPAALAEALAQNVDVLCAESTPAPANSTGIAVRRCPGLYSLNSHAELVVVFCRIRWFFSRFFEIRHT